MLSTSTYSHQRYFDNAATSYPKPSTVLRAIVDYAETVHASAGRGAYREAVESERILRECRFRVGRLFRCGPDYQVVFAFNGTDAINLALKGALRPGDHAVTTCLDHNSVLRPLSALQEQIGVTWTAVEADPATTRIDPARLAAAIRPDTRLVVVNHASNVTGVLQPLEDIAAVCHEKGVLLLVDAAQSAGHVPIDFGATPIDFLACPGHKGLLGPLGTGVLLIRAGAERHLRTVREGGTGSASESPHQPENLPDRFEAGSHNAPGIAGLLAAVRWINEQGVETLRRHEQMLCQEMADRLDRVPGLRWYGPRDVTQRVGVFSVRIAGLQPADLSAILEARYQILTRSGLHCAPFAHRTIGTLDCGGTTRLSLGPFLTREDIILVAEALAEIAARHNGGAPAAAGADARPV
ncbi:MAG: aminotransferase class V-fold PLP-dependent enzyme [Planctomycetota bacterium]